ncbi:MAG TPA: hypothetical protein VGB13_12990 [Candidatus Krumholzibacteria bacterium]|jgi:hypothetical protein
MQPLVEGGKARAIEAVDAALCLDAYAHQLGCTQDQMLRDRGRGEIERRDDLAGRAFAGCQKLDDASARGIGECAKGIHGSSISNST